LQDRTQAARKKFANHIVLCLLAESKSQVLGLANFILPLRSSSIPDEELSPILIISNEKFMEKEWSFLENLPYIYVLRVSRASSIQNGSSIVVQLDRAMC
jgi:hypothetical protein